jgi:DNA invertase Pin-like site-specific DNA recombinase
MKIGYARVSSVSQSLDIQLKALKDAGCEKIYQEKISAAKVHRPEFEMMMDFVRENDQLVVTRLDRLSRSSYELQGCIKTLDEKKVDLQVIDQHIDTSTPAGKLLFQMIGAIAEFERTLIAERADAGRKAAMARGVKFGARKKLSATDVKEIKELKKEGESISSLASAYHVGRATIYRVLKQ